MLEASRQSAPAPAVTIRKAERRRHQRVKVNLLGRLMLSDKREYPCQIVNMSPGGAALICPVQGQPGERIVAYIDHIGRVEGRVVRPIQGGFAIKLEATIRKRDKLAAQLTWLANRHVLNMPEDRRHERFVPRNRATELGLPDGTKVRCRIIDVSVSGAALTITNKPPVGSAVVLGRMRARVVRHFEDGVAIEFATVLSPESIEEQLR